MTDTTIRAERDPGFYRRFWLMGIGALAFALYCVYDGAVRYPHQRERALKHHEFEEVGDLEGWRAYAKEQGWSTADPGEPKTEVDFQVQFAMAALCTVVALALFAKVLFSLGRWIEADAEGINTSWGVKIPFEKVRSVDKKNWPKKGLASIRYGDGGRLKKFVLDNYKFYREPTDDIMRRLEANVDAEKITGAPLELPKKIETEPAETA